jgi:hypothetical protein
MSPRIQALAILEHMRQTLGSVNPKFSYWKRRVDVALVNDKELIALLRGSQDGIFHD